MKRDFIMLTDEEKRKLLRSDPRPKDMPAISESEHKCVNCEYYRPHGLYCYLNSDLPIEKMWWLTCASFSLNQK